MMKRSFAFWGDVVLEPGSQIEKYEVLSEMGSGGMARVFKVKHTLLGSTHALKVLDPKLVQDSDLRARFLAEGQIQAKLRHPNIVAVSDIIAQPGVAGLVAEFVDGPTLESVIRNNRRLPTPSEVKEVFLPLLDGLGFAHKNGIVHRDIKPSNIIVDKGHDGRPLARILDFGIAKISEDALGNGQAKGQTRTGARMGTLHYMSPEQIRGQNDVDARADIFSMAATLYEFLSGHVPFESNSDYDTMKQIVEGTPTPIRHLQPGVDPILEACIIKGLARDRESRFRSCAEFAALLSQAGTGATAPVDRASMPVSRQQTPPPSYQLQRNAYQPPAMPVSTHVDPEKIYPKNGSLDPVSAAFLSFCCLAGLGQMALGQVGKGFLLLAASIFLSLVTSGVAALVLWPLGAYDAYSLAAKLKRGQPIGKYEFFWG